MKKLPAFFLVFFLFIALMKAVDEKESESIPTAFEFIKSYRYSSIVQNNEQEFFEVQVMAKAMARLYFDFASMGSRHFAKHPVDLLSERWPDIDLLEVFFIFADRLTRHMAYVPQLYEIEIRTGLAIDPFDIFLKK